MQFSPTVAEISPARGYDPLGAYAGFAARVAGASVGAGVDAPQALKSSASSIVAVNIEIRNLVSILFSLRCSEIVWKYKHKHYLRIPSQGLYYYGH